MEHCTWCIFIIVDITTYCPLLAKRRDTPTIAPPLRANKTRALDVAGDPALSAEAVVAMSRDVRLINSAGPLSSYVRTWEEFHCKIFGVSVDIIPLTHEKIFKVGALSKLVDIAPLTTM